METDRQRRLRKLDEEYGAYQRDVDGQPFYAAGHEAWNYVLVEESAYDRGTYYVTLHHSPEAASAYHDGQEYPEDWNIVFLVNLRTGKRYGATTVTTFEEDPS